MIYSILKPLIRVALFFFCRKIYIQNRQAFKLKGPLLLTANHPNSFFDAIIIAAFFKQPIHFLARGDAFNQPYHRFLLGLLNMIPIYRLSEGKENLVLNNYAFAASKRILENNGIVLIFIEGICLLTNQLQPFKKGAARIALDYQGKNSLNILPIGIAYDAFNKWGKTVQLALGNPILAKELLPFQDRAKNMNHFNTEIKQQLKQLVIEPAPSQIINSKTLQSIADLGILLHQPLFRFIHKRVFTKTKGTVFYDSVMFGCLFIAYPLYLILVTGLLYCLFGYPAFIILVLFILSARTIVPCKNPTK
ncbi:1-acyl-sn-glycerol-3-phosphate acyltransferase [Sediminibacterium sp.]|uniref:1-acyl-sn-glycerol-3-phosphate acyltransferase n=1 Tax=Sediminibacterium sp. TaxID=1917865 RepID=UPI002736A879|nr:1-acyl-sn-glycerol-3-phosphate acyltransferase [Sediminibacterium sp.]MDP3394642.1 1-acyl-sn-glycerol-3-phosphate acyltransferase [Sediminibacterium sp.]MDP3568477.1 1-acyl-sn-glycerol-3-phosphate acyltransferase [Sediminibacterium sp.]